MAKIGTLNNTISEYRRNFYNIYHKSIIPIFEQYEIQRKNKVLFVVITCLILLAFILFMVVDICTNPNPNDGDVLKYILGTVALIALIFLPIHENNKFVSMLKNGCMMQILTAFGNISWIENVNMITDFELNNSDLFSTYNRRSSADSFKGVYKDVDFSISETNLKYETGSGKNRRIYPVFKGVVIKFEANKVIKNKTIIATRGDNNIKRNNPGLTVTIIGLVCYFVSCFFDQGLNLISIMVILFIGFIVFLACKIFMNQTNGILKREILSEVKLEDPEFSRKYVAYSSDQVEGRYLITPAFMERFKNIETAFGTHKVKCSFYRDSIMFAISTDKNLFEIGNLYHSLKDPKQMTIFFNELASILVLIDYFKLDEQTRL